MLTLRPAKTIQGKIDLPSSPDLLLLAAMCALAARRPARIVSVNATPLTELWESALHGHATIEKESGGAWTITPNLSDPPVLLRLPLEELPYRDMILFMALGMGKTVSFSSVLQPRLDAWRETARRLGADISFSTHETSQELTLCAEPHLDASRSIAENDSGALIGLLWGMRQKAIFQIDYQLSNPIRHLAQAFGYEFTVKNMTEKDADPIARRLRFIQTGRKSLEDQIFAVNADFSPEHGQSPIELSIPGDEILAAVLVAAKCLIVKGSLVIGNVSLEPWSCQILSYIRKMGSKVSIQETHRTSVGACGIISFQKFDLAGRKLECSPLYQYIGQLPSIVVIASFAEGQSVFRDLEQLRLDNPDGIAQLESCIRALGARHGEMPDGIVMEGSRELDGFDLRTPLPARIGGAFAIAGVRCMGRTTIEDGAIVQRWPDFESMLSALCEFRPD